jgi:alkylation response protein AidB-like acyl-CoA dehydrogenase
MTESDPKVQPMTALELDEFRRSLRRFVERELMPFERRAMSSAERETIQRKAKDAGFWLLDVPENLGGQGLGLLGMSVFWHEISRTTAVPARDHSLFGPVPGPILLSLKGVQKQRYLDPVLAGEKAACFAQTEPDAGADPASMRTRAERTGSDYVINGVKRFITNADKADFAQLMAVTDPAKGARGGISCFLVDMNTLGVRISAKHQTMMTRPARLCSTMSMSPAKISWVRRDKALPPRNAGSTKGASGTGPALAASLSGALRWHSITSGSARPSVSPCPNVKACNGFWRIALPSCMRPSSW